MHSSETRALAEASAPAGAAGDQPRLEDQLLYAEYLQLANEFGEQGKNPDSYRLVSWFTARRWHLLVSVLGALVGGLITAVAFNKVIAGVLPLPLRGGFGLALSLLTAALFVWGAVKAFVAAFSAFHLGCRLRGMLAAAERLQDSRQSARLRALLPLEAESRRYGWFTCLLWGLIGLTAGAVDVAALYNLLSQYLPSDAPVLKQLATLAASLITLGIVLGKATHEALRYYIPEQFYHYGRMYRAMAEAQWLINQDLLPERVEAERRRTRQELECAREELAASQQAIAQLQEQIRIQQAEQQHRQAENDTERERLEQLRLAAQGVIRANAVFATTIEQLDEQTLASLPPSPPGQPLPLPAQSNSNLSN
ncbi:hypothetical protein [Gloeobacter morelensis]|uniref:Uncharacterized protein n=1 Tax=Gloeobacter morelensis MG652769 TaxID=2781736 RepID=A0ABY3PJ66_9CYAN|nr:hypothetical protein [Gloeobacter morelensis]UFP93597.1 hypothetical protein ISF26_17670 [Gloeobacter morelensis MG652769]